MKKSYLLDELDKILALVGAIFSLTLTIWIKLVIDQPIYIMVGILCFMICIGYLIIRRFLYPSLIPSLEELRGSTRFYITLNILFFLLLSYSIISIYLRSDHYIRPIGYFISTALMATIVANEILFLSPQNSYICFTLCKIIIIGLSLEYSQILIFPNVVGVDPWWHQWFTLKILDNGHIPEGLAYSKLPTMHLMIGMTSLVTDLGYKMATMVSVSSLQVVCDALFVFLLGKFLVSTKVGLLSALVLEVATYHIFFGYWTIPNTAAATLVLPIIFIIFKVKKDKPFIGTSVVIFLMGTLILTHTVTAMYLAILLFVLWLSFEVYARLFHDEKTLLSVTLIISILFSVGMLTYWAYVSGHIMTLAGLIQWGFRRRILAEYYYLYLFSISFWERLLPYLGTFSFFIISFIGCFYMMSKQFRNSNRFMIAIGGMVILCLNFFSLIVGTDLIHARWCYYSQILMAIPLSLSLLLINGIFRSNLIKGFFMSLSVFVLSFLFITSSVVNIDNRLFSPKSGTRYAFTESELQAMYTISEIWNGMIGSDFYSSLPYEFLFNREIKCLDESFYGEDFTELQGILILVRQEILKYPYHTRKGPIKLKYDLHVTIENQNFSRIYNCGPASGYLQP